MPENVDSGTLGLATAEAPSVVVSLVSTMEVDLAVDEEPTGPEDDAVTVVDCEEVPEMVGWTDEFVAEPVWAVNEVDALESTVDDPGAVESRGLLSLDEAWVNDAVDEVPTAELVRVVSPRPAMDEVAEKSRVDPERVAVSRAVAATGDVVALDSGADIAVTLVRAPKLEDAEVPVPVKVEALGEPPNDVGPADSDDDK